MRQLLALPVCLLIASCATERAPGAAADASANAAKESAECAAAKLKPVRSLPASAIPDNILRQAQSGWVSVRYDLVGGQVQNLQVVSSHPAGLYDAYVLRHVGNHVEPSRTSVRGCVMTTNIRF